MVYRDNRRQTIISGFWKISEFSLFSCLIVLVLEQSAYAYIDPGSGSMLLQIILGGIAGAIVAVKLFWHRMRDILKLTRNRSDPEASTDDHSDSSK